jgi:pyruvate,orthophosphate dikinase
MILASDQEGRIKALAKILPMQRDDFAEIFRIMEERPCTIRLLDPPLHEFLPHNEDDVKAVAEETGVAPVYLTGTMIELPRAALRAGDIAKSAEFFSFGTNDLTQTTYGLSRDDAGKFLGDYLEAGIFEKDPFVSLDQEGVGDLIKIGVERGRAARGDLKLGICGEHGGDPASIRFCETAGLDYVSCSPYRVPIARLAAAQAALTEKA